MSLADNDTITNNDFKAFEEEKPVEQTVKNYTYFSQFMAVL